MKLAMRKVGIMAAVLTLTMALHSARADDKGAVGDGKKPAKGWVQLFNGKDLKGWKIFPGEGESWKVVDGAIVGSGAKSHLFTERGDFENFHYRIEAMINDGGNSGQYFRTQFGAGFPKGYEAQINSTHRDPVKTGSLYSFAKVLDQLVKPDEWFTQEVLASGRHIIIKVNGKKTVDFIDDKNSFTKGHFAFQQHHDGSVVKVRKVEVHVLPSDSLIDDADAAPVQEPR